MQGSFRIIRRSVFSSICALALLSSTAIAQQVDPDDLKSTVISVKDGKNIEERDIFCLDGTAGQIKSSGANTIFQSYSEQLRKAKQKIKKLKKKGASKKALAKAKKKVKTNKANSKAGNQACEELSGDEDGSPSSSATPAPSGTSTPTPQPTSDPGADLGFFFANGDMTDLGRSTFKIPAGVAANVNSGQSIYQNTCQGCHSERRGDFEQLRVDTAKAPMDYNSSNLPDSDLAQITAYLNRFQRP